MSTQMFSIKEKVGKKLAKVLLTEEGSLITIKGYMNLIEKKHKLQIHIPYIQWNIIIEQEKGFEESCLIGEYKSCIEYIDYEPYIKLYKDSESLLVY